MALREASKRLRQALKTKRGRHTVSLPSSVATVLHEQRRKHLERWVRRPEPIALVFCDVDGSRMSPDKLSPDWAWACKSSGLPKVMFPALRHTHVSAQIAVGPDVIAVTRRVGHGSPTVTLNTCRHLFRNTDAAAANAIELAFENNKRAGPMIVDRGWQFRLCSAALMY
jgi:integrase